MTAYSSSGSGSTPESTRESALHIAGPKPGARVLVIIGHREARIYDTEQPDAQPYRIATYDAEGSGRYLHYVQDVSNGVRKPERASFYRDVAKAITGAQAILVFGHGTGESSAMTQLVAELKHNYRDLAKRVIGTIVVDDGSLTERQLLAKARAIYKKQPIG